MKNLVAKLVIALVFLVGVPSFGLANTQSLTETITENSTTSVGCFRLYSNSYQNHNVFLYRGYTTVTLKGDGDTNLDLYVYDSTGLIGISESYGDYESITVTVNRADYFTIQVVNRGKVYNDYVLAVK